MTSRIVLQRCLGVIRYSQSSAPYWNFNQLGRNVKASRLWKAYINYSSRVRLGAFLSSSLAASRGLAFWSSKPAEPAPAAAAAEAAPSPEVVAAEEADRLYDANQTTELYDHLVRFKDSDDDELLWRLARACRGVAQLSSTSPADKKRLIYESLDYAQRALKINDKNFASHKWYAICLSEVGDFEGTKQKISNAFIIKEHFEQAISLNPQDATSVHLLGLWCFTFADMAWYQRKIAGVVFATPPSSTYQEALDKFLTAENVSPNFYSKNLLMIGKTYQKMGNTKMALLYLTKARDYPAKNDEDKQVINEAKQHLSSM